MKNIIEVIKGNKKAFAVKTLIVGGAVTGLVLATKAVLNRREELEVYPCNEPQETEEQ